LPVMAEVLNVVLDTLQYGCYTTGRFEGLTTQP